MQKICKIFADNMQNHVTICQKYAKTINMQSAKFNLQKMQKIWLTLATRIWLCRGCRASKKKNKSPCSSHCCLAAMQRGIIHDLQCSSLVFQNSEIISGGRLPIRAPAGCCPQQGLLELLLAKNRQNTCKICKISISYKYDIVYEMCAMTSLTAVQSLRENPMGDITLGISPTCYLKIFLPFLLNYFPLPALVALLLTLWFQWLVACTDLE